MTVMLNELKPPLEDALEHHGIKGMKWGQRKNAPPSPHAPAHARTARAQAIQKTTSGVKSFHNFNQKHKKAIRIGAAVVGVAAAAVILKNHGSLPIGSLKTIDSHGMGSSGHQAVKAFEKQVWDKKVTSVLSDINSAHGQQTQYMRQFMDSMGKTYNPRSNPFTPEARALGLPRGS